MSASPSPFTGKEEKRFEVKKRIRDVGEVVGDDEEEEDKKGIKDKIRVVGRDAKSCRSCIYICAIFFSWC